jgi:hypothetical protein
MVKLMPLAVPVQQDTAGLVETSPAASNSNS